MKGISELTMAIRSGYSTLENGDINVATHQFNKGLALDRNNVQCLKGLAICHFTESNFGKAISLLEDLKKKHPHDISIKTHLLKAHKKNQMALSTKKDLSIDEKKSLSYSYEALSKFGPAFDIRKGIEDHLSAEERLAFAELAMKIYTSSFDLQRDYLHKAIEAYEREGLNPYYSYYLLGVTYYDEFDTDVFDKEHPNMINNFEKSIALNPNFADSYYYIGTINRIIDNFEVGLKYADLAIKHANGHNSLYFFSKVRCLYHTDQYEECINLIRYMDQHDYQGFYYGFTKYLEGCCYACLRQFDTAEYYATRAETEGHDQDDIDNLRAYIERLRGEEAEEVEEVKTGFFGKISRLFS